MVRVKRKQYDLECINHVLVTQAQSPKPWSWLLLVLKVFVFFKSMIVWYQ